MKIDNDGVAVCLMQMPMIIGGVNEFIIGLFLIPLAFFNIVTNILLIFALYKSKLFRSLSHKYILVMTFSDLCLGLSAIPTLGVFFILGDQQKCLVMKIIEFWILFCEYISVLMMICISADRYLHVTKPTQYQTLMNGFRLRIIIVICLLLALLFAIFCVTQTFFYVQLVVTIGNISLLLSLIVLNKRTIGTLKEHQKSTLLRLQNANKLGINTRNYDKELSAVMTVRLVLATNLICYLPFIITNVIWTYYRMKLNQDPGLVISALYEWSAVILFSASVVNSLIIIHGNTKCRRAILSTVWKNRVSGE